MKPIVIPAKVKPILVFLAGMAFGALGTVAGPFAPVVKMAGALVIEAIEAAPTSTVEPDPVGVPVPLPEDGPEVQGGDSGDAAA